MKRATKPETHLLVVPDSLAAADLGLGDRPREVEREGAVVFYQVAPLDAQFLTSLRARFPGHEVRTLLDRIHIVAPGPADERQLFLNHLFEGIGHEYETFVDKQRNLDNIANLLSLLESRLGVMSGKRIIDLGCGTGLILQANEKTGCSLLGVDTSPAMVGIANARGLQACVPEEVTSKVGKQTIDGALASYVFHLHPDGTSLRTVWDTLRPGGCLAANFHKGRGLQDVLSILERMGGTLASRAGSAKDVHGEYALFVKDGGEA